MPDSITQLSHGMPVEIGHIDHELKKLWESAEGATTRASMINLAIYCEGHGAMTANTSLIAQLMQDHACRAILIATEPDAPENRLQAWISAHCQTAQTGHDGAKQVCCEQITFLLEGDSHRLIPSIVFAHLDSDLPLYLWWQDDLPATIDELLWRRVDRIIFDSATWEDPKSQFAILRKMLNFANDHLIPCDLNWTRILSLRNALARLFDPAPRREWLRKISRISLKYAPGQRTTTLFFIAWLMAQMEWRLIKTDGDQFYFANHEKGKIEIAISESENHGAALSQCVIETPDAIIRLQRDGSAEFYQSEIKCADGTESKNLAPAGNEDIVSLFNQELSRGGEHAIYLRALTVIESLF